MPLKAPAITPTWPAVWSPSDSSGALNRNPPMKWAGSRNCLQRLHDQEPPRVRGELPRGCAPRDTRRTSRGGPESWRMPGITRGELWERFRDQIAEPSTGDARVDAYAVAPVLCRGDRVGDLTLPPTRMEYRQLGRTGLMVSAVAFGTCQLRLVPEREAMATLLRGFELGVNLVHTAPDYEGAVELVARAARESGRDVIVASQGYGPPLS